MAKKEIEKHPLLMGARLYYSSEEPINNNGRYYYYMSKGVDKDLLFGKHISGISLMVAELPEPVGYIEEVKKGFNRSSKLYGLFVKYINLQWLYRKEVLDPYIENKTFDHLEYESSSFSWLDSLKRIVVQVINPALLSLSGVRDLELLETYMNEIREVIKGHSGMPIWKVTDITDQVYKQEEVTKRKETEIKTILAITHKEREVTFRGLKMPLRIGIEFPEYSPLKKLESFSPKVYMALRMPKGEPAKLLFYVESEMGNFIWSDFNLSIPSKLIGK